MRMNFLFGNAFWGILLLLWGMSLILKEFGVNLPLVKVFIAVLIIMFGIRLLVGGFHKPRHTGIRSKTVTTSGKVEYTTVFAAQDIDLTDLKPDSPPLEITAVFGSAYVELPNDLEFEFEPTAVLGATVIPTRPSGSPPGKGIVKIEATAVFGRVEFAYKPAKRAERGATVDSTYTESKADSL